MVSIRKLVLKPSKKNTAKMFSKFFISSKDGPVNSKKKTRHAEMKTHKKTTYTLERSEVDSHLVCFHLCLVSLLIIGPSLLKMNLFQKFFS